MKPVLTVPQMREIDKVSIDGNIEKGYQYMLKAGKGLCEKAKQMLEAPGEIALFCGKGNNGGDGYIAAHFLQKAGYNVNCYSLAKAQDLAGECRLAHEFFIEQGGEPIEIDDDDDIASFCKVDLIIDALLGTGSVAGPRGLYARVIEEINKSPASVLAADAPSGLDANSGEVYSPCVQATESLALGFAKMGMFFYPARAQVGRLAIEDLDYPKEKLEKIGHYALLAEKQDLKKILPQRKADGSKFEHGQVLLVGGSPGMSGSISLAAQAALRSGCGMVHVGAPRSIAEILAVKLYEPILHALPNSTTGSLSPKALPELLKLSHRMQALCIGPGLGHEEGTAECVRALVKTCSCPLILDADGLNAFKDCSDELAEHAGPLIMTPHRGEWKRLFGPLPLTPLQQLQELRTKALKLKAVILLKGSPSMIALPDGRFFLAPYGNSALAKAGSGDVLAGCIAALVALDSAQGGSLQETALLAAWLQGRAGELAAEELSEYSVTASEVIHFIPKAIKELLLP